MHLGKRARLALLSSISPLAIFLAGAAQAAEGDANVTDVDNLVITATRRDSTVQDAPINIAAQTGEKLEAAGITDLVDLARLAPGLTILDQGARGDNQIIVRGLNANPLAGAEALNNDGGGTVATYVGEIPFYVHLKLEDMNRVEVLLGPQGTLYGAGTLSGAIRYIPNRPNFSARTFDVRADAYGYAEGSGVSGSVGVTFNLPLSDTFAVRGSLDYLDDQGFIDYATVVKNIGVSDPDPNFNNPAAVAANLMRVEDANTERTFSGRVALRWAPTDALDINLTYYYQDMDVGGRQISSARSTVPVGRWESSMRVLEPESRTDQLVALEITYDLGFAELTSATGYSRYEESGQRDQTDLLIGLEYSYEAFPAFTAFTLDVTRQTTITQEFRLVSTTEGPVSWIVGAFYNRATDKGESREFTPHYDAFIGTSRPDSLEYISANDDTLTEMAAYGELSFQINPNWQVTLGGRYYHYELVTNLATDTPLYNTSQGAAPNAIDLVFVPGGQDKGGFLYKFNTSYKLNDDMLVYFTVSQGYRIGNSNGVELCQNPLPPGQNICGQPNELEYQPDKTTNFELGMHSEWFDRRLRINGDIYYINWEDPQVLSATLVGLQPITRNAGKARSMGLEVQMLARPNPQWTVEATYSYINAELTEASPNLIDTIVPPGFQSTVIYLDGAPGDRLPGSPEHQGTFKVAYEMPVFGDDALTFSGEVIAQSNVLSRLGGKGGGLTLAGFAFFNFRVTYDAGDWTATFYVNNAFNEFAETGVRRTSLYNQVLTDSGGGDVNVRSYFSYVAPPRVIGIRFTKSFGG